MELDAPTSLALVADAADRPVSEIQDLNPSVLKSTAPAGYALRLPNGTLPSVMAALDMVPAGHRVDWRMHRVVAGETISDIAHRYSTATATLTAANQHISLSAPVAGDLLVIPAAARVSRSAARSTVASAHARGKAARNTASARRTPANTPARKVRATPYHTASLTAKHRASAN